MLGGEQVALIRLPAINLERGRVDVASALIESVEVSESTLRGAVLQGERGRVGIARGELALGLTDLLQASGRMDGAGYSLSIDVDWVSAAAPALVALGIGLHTRQDRTAAREVLAQALDLAYRWGAWRLAEQARAELIACGARPRRAPRTGPQALTPAELRVARMAAEGRTNREIAQALFLATKTVEVQLSQAYTKLRISSRDELPDALSGGGRAAARDGRAP